MSVSIPNFSTMKALVVHRSDANVEALVSQLRRLNIFAICQWPPRNRDFAAVDMIFFDTDNGFDGMFGWSGSPPIPLIAMVGSETPGRLEWAIGQKPCAYMTKPVGSKGVFLALVTAFNAFEANAQREAAMLALEDRLRLRPIVVKIIFGLMKSLDIDDDAAFRILRNESMQRQMSIEECCSELAVSAAAQHKLILSQTPHGKIAQHPAKTR
ncbi:ANTAR domain-containing response regulator [Oryzicola mucosus]|uniref:ANTAR domain-containing protein n=1 Tax=Oryzicola mucosus TaxID=2767425 RepID=A0A8J6U3R5_9HYPH|nr:ANTAR domain-containing protein [Oryzicola mucosus]MBD0417223.1 ANTAR domain-containing protein [Oryzicola mucosus]